MKIEYIDPETGLPEMAAEKIKPRLQLLETRIEGLENKTSIINVSKTATSVGTPDQPVSQVVTADLTIVSRVEKKKDIREARDDELDLPLPRPKAYRIEGVEGELIGFIESELPEALRKPGGYSLNALVAILAYKVTKLEERLAKTK